MIQNLEVTKFRIIHGIIEGYGALEINCQSPISTGDTENYLTLLYSIKKKKQESTFKLLLISIDQWEKHPERNNHLRETPLSKVWRVPKNKDFYLKRVA